MQGLCHGRGMLWAFNKRMPNHVIQSTEENRGPTPPGTIIAFQL
jgi:hypothetical protein